MKFSVITVTLNSAHSLRDTLNSVNSQSYKNIEHIIVDGGSNDQTISLLKKYSNSKNKFYVKKGFGIYKSINYGIKKATGKYICILHSDDIFQSNDTLKDLSFTIKRNKSYGVFLGNVAYFDKVDYYKITRFYPSKNFKTWKMIFGLMPPHPASIIKREIYYKYILVFVLNHKNFPNLNDVLFRVLIPY